MPIPGFIFGPYFQKIVMRPDHKNVKRATANQANKVDGLTLFQLALEKVILSNRLVKNLIRTVFGFRGYWSNNRRFMVLWIHI